MYNKWRKNRVTRYTKLSRLASINIVIWKTWCIENRSSSARGGASAVSEPKPRHYHCRNYWNLRVAGKIHGWDHSQLHNPLTPAPVTPKTRPVTVSVNYCYAMNSTRDNLCRCSRLLKWCKSVAAVIFGQIWCDLVVCFSSQRFGITNINTKAMPTTWYENKLRRLFKKFCVAGGILEFDAILAKDVIDLVHFFRWPAS